MKPVVWGVLSTSKIGLEQVIPAMLSSPLVELRAIASRSLPSAQAAARAAGIERAYGSYEELLADPAIEAVYNPLPNHLHVPLTLQAAAAGKHVLCEKPFALSVSEAQTVQMAASRVHIEEAFMVRHHPQWLRARELVRAGRIGTPRAVQVFFSYFNDDAANIRNQVTMGGGALYDIGCYAVLAGRYLFEAEPLRAVSLVDRDPVLGTDRTTSALLDYGAGRQVSFTVSTQSVPFQRVQVVGTKGRIELFIPFNATRNGQMRLALDEGGPLDGSGVTIETLPAADQYRLEVEAFSRRVREGVPPDASGLGDAVAQARVMDTLWQSECSGRWEPVAQD
ncbi:Gfo/Idh/MocA family protein [Hydrogenophaga sp. A37]|uniref:Gfo/Idh/MocA family protein n=1 Tax=Hydrogenophaga sp. A37 TaxID=1945864 RepID=UPI000985461E|nr:Gfo/Idh/MocA family oxidoreductase [Hydrogenophaga sp. A37]OOG84933.1 NAD-binding protein [Hydrogenophaga sp. A37]